MSNTIRKFAGAAVVFAAILGFAGLFIAYKHFSALEVGEVCGDNDCDSVIGEYCLHTDESSSYCTPRCTADSDCPTEWRCLRPISINQYGAQQNSPTRFCHRPDPVIETHLLREGTATVTEVVGDLVGVSVGTSCSWRQIAGEFGDGFDVRWTVECGEHVLYGAGEGGYAASTDPSWASGTLLLDEATTSSDGDPSLIVSADRMTVRDDASGPHGAFTVVLSR